VVEETRRCKKCGIVKPISEFPWSTVKRRKSDRHRQSWRKHGCKACNNKLVQAWRAKKAKLQFKNANPASTG
jgi:hypothetical protein